MDFTHHFLVFGRQRPPILIYIPMKKHTVKLEILENGDAIVKFSDKIISEFNLKVGDRIELISHKDGIKLIPQKNKPKLDDLLDGINDDNKHDEIDFGEPKGNEEW